MEHTAQDVIKKYLLGELSQEEQQQVEKRLLADGEYFEYISSIERELIEAYVRGSLSDADRDKFEQHFMASPEQRENVMLSEDIRRYFFEKAESESRQKGDARQNVISPRHFFLPSFMNAPSLSAKALIVGVLLSILAIGAVILWQIAGRRETHEVRNESKPVNKNQEANESQMGIENRATNDEQVPQKSAQESGKTAQSQQNPVKQNEPPSANRTAGGSIVLLTLLRGQKMGNDDVSIAQLFPHSQTLRLKMYLEEDKHLSYRVELRTDEEGKILSWNGIRPQISSKHGKTLEVTIPVRLLSKENYKIVISARNGAESYSRVGAYNFRVIKK